MLAVKRAVVTAILLLIATQVGAQVNSCLVPADEFLNWACPDHGTGHVWTNPDSAMIDSCTMLQDTYPPCPEAQYYVYAKHAYFVDFDSDVFALPKLPPDTLVTMPWTDLDTSYHLLRGMFDSLQKRWGNFALIKRLPDAVNPDPWAGKYRIEFESYAHVAEVVDVLKNDSLYCFYNGGPEITAGVNELIEPSTKIFPNPVHSRLHLPIARFPATNVQIFDTHGKLIRTFSRLPRIEDSYEIDLSGLPSGEYFLRVGREQVPFIHVE